MYVFGGLTVRGGGMYNGMYNDLHEYNMDSYFEYQAWTDLSIPAHGVPPSVRYDLGFASSCGCLYVFGGTVVKQEQRRARVGGANDLHEYNVSSQTWTDLSRPVAGSPPVVRSGFGFASWEGSLYVFGGRHGQKWFNDLHAYNIALQTWTERATSTSCTLPLGRTNLALAASNGKLYVFGGERERVFFNDLYEYALPAANRSTDYALPVGCQGYTDETDSLIMEGAEAQQSTASEYSSNAYLGSRMGDGYDGYDGYDSDMGIASASYYSWYFYSSSYYHSAASFGAMEYSNANAYTGSFNIVMQYSAGIYDPGIGHNYGADDGHTVITSLTHYYSGYYGYGMGDSSSIFRTGFGHSYGTGYSANPPTMIQTTPSGVSTSSVGEEGGGGEGGPLGGGLVWYGVGGAVLLCLTLGAGLFAWRRNGCTCSKRRLGEGPHAASARDAEAAAVLMRRQLERVDAGPVPVAPPLRTAPALLAVLAIDPERGLSDPEQVVVGL